MADIVDALTRAAIAAVMTRGSEFTSVSSFLDEGLHDLDKPLGTSGRFLRLPRLRVPDVVCSRGHVGEGRGREGLWKIAILGGETGIEMYSFEKPVQILWKIVTAKDLRTGHPVYASRKLPIDSQGNSVHPEKGTAAGITGGYLVCRFRGWCMLLC